jgi:DNA-binding MarR family transcriptional regulator
VNSKADFARDAWLHLTALFVAGENHDRLHRVADELALTPGQMHALLDLRSDDPVPMRAIAQTMSCDASYATSLVDGLERLDYVERRVSESDRRMKLVHLTPLGEQVRQKAIDLLSVPPKTFDRLSAAELRTLRDLLVRVTDEFPF